MLPSGIPLKQGELWDLEEEGDPLVSEAIDLVRREGRASITMLQRKMRLGYPKAAYLIDRMEQMGIVGPVQEAGRARDVLIGDKRITEVMRLTIREMF